MYWGFPGSASGKLPPATARDLRDAGLIPGIRKSMEEGMVIHFTILAWRIPWTEAPGRLWSGGSIRVGCN